MNTQPFTADDARRIVLAPVGLILNEILEGIKLKAAMGCRRLDVRDKRLQLKAGKQADQTPVTIDVINRLNQLGFTTQIGKGLEGHAQNSTYWLQVEW